jgi:hypothetical protein
VSGAVLGVGLAAAYLVGVVVGLFTAAVLRASDEPTPPQRDRDAVPDYVPAEWTRAES